MQWLMGNVLIFVSVRGKQKAGVLCKLEWPLSQLILWDLLATVAKGASEF